MPTNNITRFLDSRGVKYKAFELPGRKLGAEETAAFLGAPPAIVFKSIVLQRRRPGKPILAVVPGDSNVDQKALAKIVGEKKVTPATQNEAERLTKLQAGGISPLALINRGFEIVIDASVFDHETVHVSGGELGINILLPSRDLVDLTRAKVGKIS
jgi:Cys-tRNA(Pro)/Cys-tRNA(Cys) deacylase